MKHQMPTELTDTMYYACKNIIYMSKWPKQYTYKYPQGKKPQNSPIKKDLKNYL